MIDGLIIIYQNNSNVHHLLYEEMDENFWGVLGKISFHFKFTHGEYSYLKIFLVSYYFNQK